MPYTRVDVIESVVPLTLKLVVSLTLNVTAPLPKSASVEESVARVASRDLADAAETKTQAQVEALPIGTNAPPAVDEVPLVVTEARPYVAPARVYSVGGGDSDSDGMPGLVNSSSSGDESVDSAILSEAGTDEGVQQDVWANAYVDYAPLLSVDHLYVDDAPLLTRMAQRLRGLLTVSTAGIRLGLFLEDV